MQLVFLLQPAQDRDGVLDRRLRHEDRLEAPGERRVLLHVLAIFVERGGADAMELAAGERRLQQVRGVHGAVGLAGADQRMHLVDEQDDLAVRRLDLREHGLQPLLELAAIFGAGDQRAEIERQHLLVLQALGHVAVDDAMRQPLDDGRLADARLADQHGIVLGAAGQHLDGAPDLLVAADHRIELAFGGGLGEVAGVALQRVIGLLGAGRIRGAALAQIVDGGVERLRRDPGIGEDARGLGLLGHGERLEHPLDGDEAVAGLGRHLLGLVEHAAQGWRPYAPARPPPETFGSLASAASVCSSASFGLPPALVISPAAKPFRVVEQHLQQMLRRDLRVAFADGEGLRRLHEALEPVGEFLEIHGTLSLLSTLNRHCGRTG